MKNKRDTIGAIEDSGQHSINIEGLNVIIHENVYEMYMNTIITYKEMIYILYKTKYYYNDYIHIQRYILQYKSIWNPK